MCQAQFEVWRAQQQMWQTNPPCTELTLWWGRRARPVNTLEFLLVMSLREGRGEGVPTCECTSSGRCTSSDIKETNASLIAQLVKNPPAMQKTLVQFLDWEDPLEKGKATHCSILAWRILRTGVSKSWMQLSNSYFLSKEARKDTGRWAARKPEPQSRASSLPRATFWRCLDFLVLILLICQLGVKILILRNLGVTSRIRSNEHRLECQDWDSLIPCC